MYNFDAEVHCMKNKRIISVFLVLAMLFTLTPAVFAEGGPDAPTYYVDSENGDDSFDGLSQKTPFKTFKRAFSMKFEPGYTILFKRGGTYQGGLQSVNAWISSSGTSDAPITLGAYGEGNNPVITTSADEIVLALTGSYINISGLDFTAPNGAGIRIMAMNGNDVVGINIDDCRFYNIYTKKLKSGDPDRCGIKLSTDNSARAHDCSFTDLELFNSAYGIDTNGITFEFANSVFISPEESYHYNILFDNIYCHDIQAGGLILGGMRDTVVRNSRFINTASNVPFAVAAVWTHGCDRVMIEYCEIAGSKNLIDGMTIDFDGWTTNSTYRYIYSHDNTRFMRNCVYDGTTKNRGNTVDHCLSVNDNKMPNIAALPLANTGTLKVTGLKLGLVMDKFTFTNNIIINCLPFYFGNLTNANISNNYFGGKSIITSALSIPRSVLSATCHGTVKNNSFYHYSPLLGCGNKATLKATSASAAYAGLFPNGVHTP